MISSEVQRTLVKSPPELWAELSDPAALARHLGELGEIRIVRTQPESTVEWAAENTTGIVSIKPSGWGTKVTLSVTREVAAAAPAADAVPAPEAPPAADASPEAEAAPEAEVPAADALTEPGAAIELEPAAVTRATAEPEPTAFGIEVQPTAEPEPALETVNAPERQIEPEAPTAPGSESQPEARRGFFARLFGRRRREAPSGPAKQTVAVAPTDPPALEGSALSIPEAPDAFAAVRQVLAPDTFAAEHPFVAAPEFKRPVPEPSPSESAPAATEPEPTVSEPKAAASELAPDTGPEQADDISAELGAAEEAGTAEVNAVLTAVLDRLGAAHHRPFSRS